MSEERKIVFINAESTVDRASTFNTDNIVNGIDQARRNQDNLQAEIKRLTDPYHQSLYELSLTMDSQARALPWQSGSRVSTWPSYHPTPDLVQDSRLYFTQPNLTDDLPQLESYESSIKSVENGKTQVRIQLGFAQARMSKVELWWKQGASGFVDKLIQASGADDSFISLTEFIRSHFPSDGDSYPYVSDAYGQAKMAFDLGTVPSLKLSCSSYFLMWAFMGVTPQVTANLPSSTIFAFDPQLNTFLQETKKHSKEELLVDQAIGLLSSTLLTLPAKVE